jgi:hypothetical protein
MEKSKGFEVTINDRYCVYKYDLDVGGDVSIADVARSICEKFNCELTKGEYCGDPQIEQHVKQDNELEKKVNKAKTCINILSKMQDHCFQKLATELKFDDKGEEMLFDYIYNSGDDGLYLNFEEWLSYYKYHPNDFAK